MLYDDVCIGKVVCLKCGAKVDVDKLAVIDVGEMDDIPEEIKARGSFFQTLACPKCKKSMFLGFVAEAEDDEEEAPKTEGKTRRKRRRKKSKGKEEDQVVANKSGIKRSEDGTIDVDNSTNRQPKRTTECTQCGAKFDVGTQDMMAFGTKCKRCMNALVGGGRR